MSRKYEIIIFALLLVGGCVNDKGEDLKISFGSPYGIDTRNGFPKISYDSLIVQVNYSGCTRNHSFKLEFIATNLSAQLWLLHETPGEACEMYVEETKSFLLPNEIRNKPKIFLVGPNNYAVDLK
jgi:hypothetical protein